MWNSGINHNYILLDFLFKLYLFKMWLYLGVLWPKNAQISKSRSFLEMAKSTGFEFVDQIEFGRFSVFTKFQIIVVLVNSKVGSMGDFSENCYKIPKNRPNSIWSTNSNLVDFAISKNDWLFEIWAILGHKTPK